MESFLQDIRFGSRLLWKSKGFAATAISTLAICIAANSVIFSVVHSVIMKPLPLAESDRILTLYNSYPNVGVKRASNGVPDYYDRRRAVPALEDVALFTSVSLAVGEKGSVQQTPGMDVTPSFFKLIRVMPQLGRDFVEAEGEIGNNRKVILSFSLWQELFGGDRSVLNKDLRIYSTPYTIVGIMPKEFVFVDPQVRLWRPLAFRPEQRQEYHSNSWEMIGRLKPGATVQQVQAQLDALNKANLDIIPQLKPILINAGFHTKVFRLQDEMVKDVKGTLYLLWGGVLFVLLIGTVNIANLSLARSSVRMKELATRFALGAGRGRLARHVLTESVLLSLCGALAGLLAGWWGLRALGILGLDQIPRGSEVAMDGSVVAFIFVAGLLAGMVVGLVPVVHTLQVDLNMVIRSEGRAGTSGRPARLLRGSLAVTQVAFALVLLVGAGLLLTSFLRVLAVKPGFTPDNVITATVSLPRAKYKDGSDQRKFANAALDQIRALPGVVQAGATDTIPFGHYNSDAVLMAEGYVMKPGESLISPSRMVASAGYFEAMRIPLIEGRLFDARDAPDSPKTVIVDQRLARKYWPDSSPIGRRMWKPNEYQDLVQPGPTATWYTVVGVVGSIKLRALVDPDERVGGYYFPYEQSPQDTITFAVKSSTEPTSLLPALRKTIQGIDAEIPLYDAQTMERRIAESLISRKSPMLLAMGFGGVALFLAVVGIYGVLAYMVAQRTREIGIRMALGGGRDSIFRLVLREGLLLLLIGFGLGFAGTLGLSRYVESVLFGIRPMDPAVLASASAVLAAAAILACALPARRATRVDPIEALRME